MTTVSAQERMITGTIKDNAGITLPGVNILIVGSSVGTTTSIDGVFKLALPQDVTLPVLQISAVGYKTLEVEVGNQTNFNLTLDEDVSQLEEVVVVGYGKQNKALMTTSVSSVKTADLESYSAGSVQNSLTGRIAGVNVVPSGGSPGAGIKVRVRGTGSNGNSDPLYIVDGMRVPNIDFLDPLEIGSMQVLKDAASTAIYGAEGANGVVYVTTKEGKAGETRITYDLQYGVQSVDTRIDLMNLNQFEEYWGERGLTRDHDPLAETNWLDELFQTAPQQRHALTISGGNEKSTFFVSGNFFTQDGVIGGDLSKFDRFSIRLNGSHQVKDWLNFSHQASYASFKRNNILENDSYGGIVQTAMMFDPATPVTFSNGLPTYVTTKFGTDLPYQQATNGQYYGVSTFTTQEIGNPIGLLNADKNTSETGLFYGSFLGSADLMDGLKLNSRMGMAMSNNSTHSWQRTYFYTTTATNGQANSRSSMSKFVSSQWENWLSYDKQFGDHDISVILGSSVLSQKTTFVAGEGGPLFGETDELSYLSSIPNGQENTRAFGNEELVKLMSYYGRFQYNYKQRYLLGITARTDGSSLLAEGKRWGFFPSVSGGWVISNEEFFDVPAIAFAKLRASWGRNGSLSNLYPGASIGLVSPTFQYTNADGEVVIGAEPLRLSNPELTWETSEQLNIGMDLGFLDDRLTVTADYFDKQTKDLLNPGTPPSFVGNFPPIVNSGTVKNTGFELGITYDKNTGPVKYSISANMTRIENVVTEIDPNKLREEGTNIGGHWNGATAMEEGYPLWYFRGYKTNGIFQSQEQIDEYHATIDAGSYPAKKGDPIIVDVNGDGQINSGDFTEIGSPHADLYLGLNAKVEYKNFDLQVFAQGSFGNDVLIGYARTDVNGANYPSFFYEDRWTESNATNDWFGANFDEKALSSDFMVQDASFVKIRQLQLGYNLPSAALDKLKLGSARFYVSLDNFFTFSSYKGFDPEIGGSNDDKSLGIDRGVYPTPRLMMTGLSVKF
ncbi:SusC/RagA family TonB-linked outer membrane protein [Sediminitomix flava]|uniref:SusC/RagA family TonB-linked outer membrane protein n=1 Tax=Sediminitomix flava TaxID=379075 RepID=UPI001304C502|nr:TonB-dependent receptor [Sediminitomix flava]